MSRITKLRKYIKIESVKNGFLITELCENKYTRCRIGLNIDGYFGDYLARDIEWRYG